MTGSINVGAALNRPVNLSALGRGLASQTFSMSASDGLAYRPHITVLYLPLIWLPIQYGS
jgi:hypothetical protein